MENLRSSCSHTKVCTFNVKFDYYFMQADFDLADWH